MSVEHVSLCRCRVLYLGSAIPLETAVGIESIQMPCRERYGNVDSQNKASGIDCAISVYSSGIMLQYVADPSSSTWFPINTLHVCAAVKAIRGNGSMRFVSLDTAAAQRSANPPMFACIMRRTKGVKVLECHVFICKSNQAAMALVQSCTHAFEHKEGWSNSMPASSARIFADKGGKGSVKGGGLFAGGSDLIQKFDVSCKIDEDKKPQTTIQQLTPVPNCNPGMIAMNPPGAPVPAMQPMMQQAVPNEYFADWNMYAGQPLMIIPDSPFYPGDDVMGKRKKKKKKNKKKSKKSDTSSDEEETYYVKKSALGGGGDSCSLCGTDSLRSRMKGCNHGCHGRGHGGHGGHGHRDCNVVKEEVIQLPPPPQPQPPPPPPQPPIIFVPQPQPDVHKNQQNPNTDVVVYAPQYIEANKDTKNLNYDDRDNDIVDYRPDNRQRNSNSSRRMYDGREDNRVNYNRQHYRRDDYRADQRQLYNNEDNRMLDYRPIDYRNLDYNEQLDYDNRQMYLSTRQMQNQYQAQQVDGGMMYDPEEEFRRGYYNAQVEDYNRQLDDYYADDADQGVQGYLYYPQPGYTDDYGVADYTRHLPAEAPDGGRYILDTAEDYTIEYVPASQAQAYGGQYNQVADGLGYYP